MIAPHKVRRNARWSKVSFFEKMRLKFERNEFSSEYLQRRHMQQYISSRHVRRRLYDENNFFYFLFLSMLFLSKFIFSYDEEKIIALCLISFVCLLYINIHESVSNILLEQNKNLKIELFQLLQHSVIAMKKISYWIRVLLDVSDRIAALEKSFFICWNAVNNGKNRNRVIIHACCIKNKYIYLITKINKRAKDFYLFKFFILRNFFLTNFTNKSSFNNYIKLLKKIVTPHVSFETLLKKKLKINFLSNKSNLHVYLNYLV